MLRSPRIVWMLCGLAVLTFGVDTANAQQRGGGGRGFGTRARFELATLPEVQADLKLNDEQKKLASDLLAKQREKRQALGQDAFGASGREEMAKFNTSSDAEFVAKLNDAQKTRLNGLLVQVNGAAALLDPTISTSLKLSEDDLRKLRAANDANMAARREAFQGLQDMTPEQRQEAMAKQTAKESEKLLALLNDEQKKAFADLKGAPLSIDQTPLRVRRN